MHILLVTPLLPHPGSVAGGALVMFGQLPELASRHRISLVTFATPHDPDREGVETLARLGIEVHPVWREQQNGWTPWTRRARLALNWLRGAAPLRTLKFADTRLQEAILRLAAEHRFDLLQIEDNAMGAYRYPPGVPALFVEHEVRGEGETSNRARVESRRWVDYQRSVWGRFKLIQVFTRHDAEMVGRIAPEAAPRVRVNPFGVAVGAATDPALEKPGELVFVGAFHHRPNIDSALWLGRDIFPIIRRLAPHAHLTIVGSDPPRRVRALAGPSVEVTGRVARVEPWLERAALVIAPIRSGGGMRVKVLQAMAMGKAVITTPLGAEGLAADPAGAVLIAAPEPNRLAESAAALLSDDAARRELGRRARAFVLEHHGWAAYVGRLEAMYHELGVGG